MVQRQNALVVEATNQIAVRNTAGIVIPPGFSFRAWEEDHASDSIDVAGGSRKPIAFKIPKEKVESYRMPGFRITGGCAYPPNFPREATCRMVGTLPGAPEGKPAIVSQPWNISLPVTNPPTDTILPIGAHDITSSSASGASGFEMAAMVTDKPCPVPFRFSGNFRWHIECLNQPGISSLQHPMLTRLELLWLCGPALVGQCWAAHTDDTATLNFDGVYPINLLRLYLPRPIDLPALTIWEKSGSDYRDWWIQQSLARLPSDRFVYNTISGKSGFGVGCTGGSFALRDFTSHAFRTPNFVPEKQLQSFVIPADGPQPMLINSFDLAALVQLAYGLLVDSNGAQIMRSRWVCKTPFGAQTLSVPYGTSPLHSPTIMQSGVNNPYFLGIDGAQPLEADPNKRPLCNVRAWVEAALPAPNSPDGVIDIGWRYHNGDTFQADLRDKVRAEYASRRIEGFVNSTELFNFKDDDPNTTAQCFQNPEFGTRTVLPPVLALVGVYDTNGILPARVRPSSTTMIPIPPSLRQSIDDLISRGQNAKRQRWMYNDASLRSANICPIIAKGTDWVPESTFSVGRIHTDVKVASGATCASYYFSGIALSSAPKGRLVVNINVFEDFHYAYEAFVFELTKYERNVTDIAIPCNDLGHHALRTPHSILCMRGNLFIEMTIESFQPVSESSFAPIYAAMKRLDGHLARRVVGRSQLRRARLNPSRTETALRMAGNSTQFDLAMSAPEKLLPVMSIHTKTPDLLLWTKFDTSTFIHTLCILVRPDKKNVNELVTIRGAHFDTFYPVEIRFTVVIQALNP